VAKKIYPDIEAKGTKQHPVSLHAMMACRGSESLTPVIHSHSTRWRRVVSYIPGEVSISCEWLAGWVLKTASEFLIKNYLGVHRPLAVRGQWQYEIRLECFHV